jgi:hypothetical protein
MARPFRLATPGQRSCKAPEADGPESIHPDGRARESELGVMIVSYQPRNSEVVEMIERFLDEGA